MKSFPFPVRLAAGLAVTTAQRARALPGQLAGLPVTLVSQALQVSMRVQQNVTEIAIRGDDALSVLRPVEQSPSWATFDEDLPEDDLPDAADDTPGGTADRPGDSAGHRGDVTFDSVTALDTIARDDRPRQRPEEVDGDDPWAAEERALARDYPDGTFDSENGPDSTGADRSAGETTPSEAPAEAPAGVDDYDELTLPQLRARLRRFSLRQLEQLLAYERAHANRASFTGMLSRRIDNVRAAEDESSGQDAAEQ